MKQRFWKWAFLILFLGVIVYLGVHSPEMPGADTHVSAVTEKYASEVGAGERPPLINTDKGDLLLFMFAIGGAVAGFVIGYTWRDLFGGTKNPRKSKPSELVQLKTNIETPVGESPVEGFAEAAYQKKNP